MDWINKKHWVVATWPLDEEGNLSHHHSWRTAIVHGDSEEEVMAELVKWLVPSHTPFRLWMMELTEENARDGVIYVKAKFKDKKK